MTTSIWRYSHLTLAISSALFIIIASITGIILAFEPILNKSQPFAVVNLNDISISETVAVLQKEYDEVIALEIDENNFVAATIITKKGKSEKFYINPETGEKVGNNKEKLALFEFATNLHRSLFLKSTGRFLIGFVSFLLFLIAITGVLLISKRQGGIHKIFSKIVKENYTQYYHIVISRYTLIPIIIITLTGVYLSLEKFSLLPKDTNSHQNTSLKKEALNSKTTDFEIFKSTNLDKVKKIEFPFSSDEEDSFFIKLHDKELAVHQYNGQIVSEKRQSLVALGSHYSLLLHTGDGSILWATILVFTCFAILFFIYSGFVMALKRKREISPIKNKISKDEAEYVILVGSETGSTIRSANAFKNALIKANKRVFIAELNNYTTYKKAKNLIIFTATYGDGDAPTNAHKFMKLIGAIQQNNSLKFAVLGFGSTQYTAFCKFAILVHASLQVHLKFTPVMPLFKIDNQNLSSFRNWIHEWGILNHLSLEIDESDIFEKTIKETFFKVANTSEINVDDTFLIELKSTKKTKFTSGDLLSISPNRLQRNRLYSIAKIDKKILLSVKKHEFGVCSNYLHQLKINDSITTTIQKNDHFHFPKKVKEVILIANGTGIAPFLGMIQENKKAKVHLFWGGRTKNSLKIYNKYIVAALENKTLTSFNVGYSVAQKTYVQQSLASQSDLISNALQKEGVIMICGSLNMQKGVEKVINKIAKEKLSSNIEILKENNQIKTDCY
ncbi:PepSY domain-containing protein [uncultured Polaribacter sp.]|uniref:PepSY domain-containing protein n=1 Tax=uncultured Polaribacter sp. TaxID=174711 RepID=UPI002615A0ED|nr:PepSY domain-containing protein [uncultured Polaribacter sp.]